MLRGIRSSEICGSPIIRGQLISVLIAGTGIFASLLSRSNANFPEFMSFLLYVSLLTFALKRWIREKKAPFTNLSNHWSYYVIVAVFDVEANFMIIEAYKYTSITSVMLLDCFAIPFAMILSYLFINARYKTFHFIGTIVCLFGMGCTIISDARHGSISSKYKTPLFGDALTLLAASLYACSNVLQEKLMKNGDRDEFLSMLGVIGSSITLIQFLIFDLQALKIFRWDIDSILYVCGFVCCLYIMYTNTTLFLKENDSVVFNLSILTSDIYSVVFSYFVYGYIVDWLYCIAFLLSAAGLLLYNSVKSPVPAISNELIAHTQLKDMQSDSDSPSSMTYRHSALSSEDHEEEMYGRDLVFNEGLGSVCIDTLNPVRIVEVSLNDDNFALSI